MARKLGDVSDGMETKTLQYPLRVPEASLNETDRPSRGGGASEVGSRSLLIGLQVGVGNCRG